MATMQSARFVEPTSMAQLEDLFCEWKSTKSHRPDVLNYFQEVFKSKQFANVTISANDGFGGVQEILAHGCVLKHGSDFFASSLSGRWGDDLKVDLTSYEFNAAQINSLIAYLYTGSTTLYRENVLIMYKLSIVFLSDQFQRYLDYFLLTNSIDDACRIASFRAIWDLNRASLFLKELSTNIRSNPDDYLKNPEMIYLTKDQLTYIFQSPMADSVTAMQVFRFCLRWAEKSFGMGVYNDLRSLDKLFLVEFNMKKHYPKLPTGNTLESSPGIKDNIYFLNRFNSVDENDYLRFWKSGVDRISLRVSHDVDLVGLGIFGNFLPESLNKQLERTPHKYDVNINIYHRENHNFTILSSSKTQQHDPVSKMDHLMLANSVVLLADVWYTIAVQISGTRGRFYGANGVATRLLTCGGVPVLVEFMDASLDDDKIWGRTSTGVRNGQIPRLLFKMHTNDPTDDSLEVLTV